MRKEVGKMNVINANGYELDFDAAVQLMDDESREEWELSKENPCW